MKYVHIHMLASQTQAGDLLVLSMVREKFPLSYTTSAWHAARDEVSDAVDRTNRRASIIKLRPLWLMQFLVIRFRKASGSIQIKFALSRFGNRVH